ncbi:MAG TPA: cyclic nucleotide-binding domain-containing protein [Actinomycetes bacterium]
MAGAVTDRTEADWTDVLASVPLFAGLSKRHVHSIAKLAKVQSYPAFTELVREGHRGESFYLILDGTAVVRPPGKRAVKLGFGDFFGELSLLDNAPRSATVQAQSEVLVARIGRTDFLRMLQHEPKVALVLLTSLAGRLRATEASARH